MAERLFLESGWRSALAVAQPMSFIHAYFDKMHAFIAV
jgi:hypothetical protein